MPLDWIDPYGMAMENLMDGDDQGLTNRSTVHCVGVLQLQLQIANSIIPKEPTRIW